MSNPEELSRTDGTYSPLDLDQNGVVDALTDGLMVLRYLFGLSGDGVTQGALAGDATRTAEEVLEYLDWVKSHEESELYKAFDLDNSGDLDALTDGLMLLRHSFGLTGDAVTKGGISSTENEEGVKVPTATSEEVIANLDNAINVLQQVPKDDEGNYGVTDPTAEPEPEPVVAEPEPEPVVANPVTLGDVDAVADYLAAGATLTDEQEAKYDVNGDGEVDDADFGLLSNAYRDGDYAGFKEDTLFSPEPEPEPEPELDSDNDGTIDEFDPAPYNPDIKSDLSYENYFLSSYLQSADYFEGNGLYSPQDLGDAFVSPEDYDPQNLFTYDTDKDGIADWYEVVAAYDFKDINENPNDEANENVLLSEYEWDEILFGNSMDYTSDVTLGQALNLSWKAPNNDLDGDGVLNSEDAFPYLSTEWADSDGDRLGDNEQDPDVTVADPDRVDSDGDGVFDVDDDFPNDASETADSDNDGVGDNADAFPNDASESTDSDNDGTGDNADAFPNDDSETTDTDNDGTGDNTDFYPEDETKTEAPDFDKDGVADNIDAFPYDPNKTEADPVAETPVPRGAEPVDNGTSHATGAAYEEVEKREKEYSERFYLHKDDETYNHQNTDELKEILGIDSIAQFENGQGLSTGTNAILYQGYERPLTADELYEGWKRIMGGAKTVQDPRSPLFGGSTSGDSRLVDMGELSVGTQPFSNMSGSFGDYGYIWDAQEYTYEDVDGNEVTEPISIANVYDFWFGSNGNDYTLFDPRNESMLRAGAMPIIFNGEYNVMTRAAQMPKLYDFNMSGGVPSEGTSGTYNPLFPQDDVLVYYSSKEAAERQDPSEIVEIVRNVSGAYYEKEQRFLDAKAAGTAVSMTMHPDVDYLSTANRRRIAADQYVKDHSQGVLWEAGATNAGQAITFDIQTGENPDGSAISLLEGFETKYNYIAEENGVPVRAEDPTAGLIRGADEIPDVQDIVDAYFMIRTPAFGVDNAYAANTWLASLDPLLQDMFYDRDVYNPTPNVLDDLIATIGDAKIISAGGLERVDPESIKAWSDGFKGTDPEKKSAKELSDALTSYHSGEYLEFGALSIIAETNKLAEVGFNATVAEQGESVSVGTDTLLNELKRSNSIIGMQDVWYVEERTDQPEYQAITSNAVNLEMDRQLKYAIERSAPYMGDGYNAWSNLQTSYTGMDFVPPTTFGTDDGYPTIMQDALFYDERWINAYNSSVVARFEPPMYMEVPEENQAKLWPGGEDSGELWRDTSRLYMKLPSSAPKERDSAQQPVGDLFSSDTGVPLGAQFDYIDMDAPYRAYQKAIKEGKTEAQAQAAAAEAPNPNDYITKTWAEMGETRSIRATRMVGGHAAGLYSASAWDTSQGGYPAGSYTENAPDGGVWVDISNGMAPIGSYTMMYVAQPPFVEEQSGWSSPVGQLFSSALAMVSPATYLVLQGIRALDGATLKTGDWINIVTAGLKVGGKLKPGGTKAEAEVAGEAARDEAIAKSGNLSGQALAGVGDAAYAAEYTTTINGIGIAGLTAKQTVVLINAAGGEDIGTAIFTAFGPDYLEKGFSNLGVDTSFYTNMSEPVQKGFTKLLTARMDGKTFTEALKEGGVEFFAEYISDNDLVSEVKLVVDNFLSDLGPAISAVGDLFNESQLGDALDAVLDLVPEDFIRGLGEILDDVEDTVDPILALAEKGLEVVDDVVVAPLVELVKGAGSRIELAVEGVVDLFPDGLPEGIENQITAIVEGLEEKSKLSFANLPDASKKAVENSVAQLIVNGEIESQGLNTAFTKELITAETVNELIETSEGKTKDVLTAIGPGVLTTAMRASINMGLAGGSVGDTFIQTIATSTANAIKYAADAGGIEGLTREISQFQDNISGERRRVEEAAAIANGKDEDMRVVIGEIGLITGDINTRQTELSRLYEIAISADASAVDIARYEQYAADFINVLPELQSDLNDKKGTLADIEGEYDQAVSVYTQAVEDLEQYSRDTDPKLQLEFSNMYVAVSAELNEDFVTNWPQYAQVNGLGADATLADAARHYLSEGYVGSVPTTVEEYNARISMATNAFVDEVVADSGINFSYLAPNSRASIREAILNEVSTFAGVEGVTPLQMLETMRDDSTYRDGFKAGTEFDNVILQAYNQSYITAEGAPLNFTNLGDVENYALELRANQFTNAYAPIDIKTGAPVDPAAYSQYLTDLIDGQLFVSLNEDGDYTWDAATETIKYNALTGLQEVVDTVPGKTLSQLAAEDPIFYVQTLGEIEDNAAAVNLVAKVQEETGETFEIPDYSDTVFGTPDSELPWIVRVSRDYMQDIAVTRQEYLAKVEELESFEGPLNPEQELELEETRGAYETADRQLMTAYNVINVGESIVGAYNTIYQTFGVAGQEGRARKEGEKAMFNAIQQGMDTDEAKELGAKVTEELMAQIDYSPLRDNELSRTLNMLEGVAKGYVPETYTKEVEEMYARWDEAETFGEGVVAVFGSIAVTPRAFWNEIIIQELGETAIQLATSGGLGFVTKEVAKRQADNILASMTSAQIGTGVYTVSVAQDVAMEYGQNVEEVYDTTMSLLFTKDEYVNPPQYIADQGEDAVQTYREGLEQGYNKIAFDTSVNAGTFAMATVLATLPFEGSLDKLLSKKFFGDVGLDTLELVAEDTNLLRNTVGDYLGVIGKEGFAGGIQEGLTVGYAENAYYNLGFTDRPAAAEVGVALTVGSIADAGATAIIAPLGYLTPQAQVASQINDPLGRVLVTTDYELYQAVESGDVSKVSELIAAVGLATVIPMNMELLNATDDSYILTSSEVIESYESMGLTPTQGFVDQVASTLTIDADTGQITTTTPIADGSNLDDDLAYYWASTFGDEDLPNKTGYTSEEHFDVVQHVRNMADGLVPLSNSFNYDGDAAVTYDDANAYILNLPRYERELFDNYRRDVDAGTIEHVPTDVVQTLGGSLMTNEELDQLKANIQTLLDAQYTKQEIINAMSADPTFQNVLNAQVVAAVETAFLNAENQANFAAEVVDSLVESDTLGTLVGDVFKSIVGDPDAAEAEGVFALIEDLKEEIGLGEDDPATLVSYIDEAIGTAVELNADGTVKEGTGSGLLGELTAQGVLQDVAIAALNTLVGSPAGDKDATGLYAAVANVDLDTTALEAEINTLAAKIPENLETTLANLTTNLGTPSYVDDNGVLVSATGIYAKVEEAIAAGTGAEQAVKNILGDYVDFAAFETALTGAMQAKVDQVVASVGTPAVFQYGDDGDVLLDDMGKPLFAEGGAPTGYHADMYNALQLQGTERDIALYQLQQSLNAEISKVSTTANAATVDKIKTDVIGPLMPAIPAGASVGRDMYIEFEGLVKAGRDDDALNFANTLSDADRASLEAYQLFLQQHPDSITALVEELRRNQIIGSDSLSNRINFVETNVNNFIQTNVVDVIGKRAEGDEGASGIFLAIEQGDDAVLEQLGTKSTFDEETGLSNNDGTGVLRSLELLGYDNQQIKDYLDTNLGKPAVSEDEATDDNPQRPASGIFALFEENTENYNSLVGDYNKLAGDALTLAGEFQTLAESTADKITAIDTTIGTLPTDDDGDGVFEGGSGLRLELFNQGLSIDEVNNVLGSEDDTNSILGRLAAIKSTADGAATASALTIVDNELGTLSTIVGVQDTDEGAEGNQGSGLFGEIQSLAATTASNTEKYETLLTDYSDISGKYDTLAEDFETLAESTANKITAIDTTIGTLPTDDDGDGVFEGGSGLRLELFNQGLSVGQIESLLGSEDDTDSILGRLKIIKDSTDLSAKQANLTALEGIVGNAESGLVKTVNDIAQGIVDRESGYNALVEQVSGIAEDYGERFEEFDAALEGVATTEQVQDVQDTITQVADFMGIPPNEVTEQDMEAFATIIADFELGAETVAQEDMLRYDVSGVDGTPDGILDEYDQQVLQAGFEGDYSGFAPDAQFNQATGMFLQQQQDQDQIAALEQEAIDQAAKFETQRQADIEVQAQRDAQLRADFQEDLREQREAEKTEEFMQAFTAPGRTRTTTTPQDPADIRYFYDIAGEDIFANQQQGDFYGAASPFGDNFMNEILTPPRRKAKGGLIDETDEILKILGE